MTVEEESKKERKFLERKRTRHVRVLIKAEDVQLDQVISREAAGWDSKSEELLGEPVPTNILCLLNGFSAEIGHPVSSQVQDLIRLETGFRSLHMALIKPYSFVVFDTPANAQRAKERFDGKDCIKAGKVPLIEYVRFIPQSFINLVEHFDDTVDGLTVYENVISQEHEEFILDLLQDLKWDQLKTRFVAHYGRVFNYKNRRVDLEAQSEMPQFALDLLEIFGKLDPYLENMDQLTISKYPSGAGIGPHVDSHCSFKDIILSFSLGTACVMEFSHPDTHTMAYRVLKPRSLLVMASDARYIWSHSIRARKADIIDQSVSHRGTRISFTFRQVREDGICQCGLHTCDS